MISALLDNDNALLAQVVDEDSVLGLTKIVMNRIAAEKVTALIALLETLSFVGAWCI